MFYCLAIKLKHFWCRCGWGKHPFPSRTRRLRPNRPMVLHWRRCGRAGGRQIKKKTTGWKPDEDKTGIGKWVLSETGWSQIRIVKSGANPYQPGRAVDINWFYQWLEVLKERSGGIESLRFLMTDKASVNMYLENCIHEIWLKVNQISLIQNVKRKIWEYLLKRKIGRHRY